MKSRADLVPYVMGRAVLFQFFDAVAVATALPQISRSLGIDTVTATLVITAYLVGMAVTVPAAGWLADAYGGTNVLRVTGVFLILSMIACYFAPTFSILIVARFFAGASASLILPVGRLLVIRNAPCERLPQAVTTFTMLGQIGPIAGPPLSGALIYFLGWRSVFMAQIPLALLMIASVTWLRAKDGWHDPGRLDLRGLLLCVAALLCMVGSMEMLGHGVSPVMVAGALMSGLAFLIVLVRHSRGPNRLIDFALLRRPILGASLLSDFPIRMVAAASPMLVSLLIQEGLHQTALLAGAVLLAPALGNLAVKPAYRFVGPIRGIPGVMACGALLASLSFAGIALIVDAQWQLILFALLVLHGLGRAMVGAGATILNFTQVSSEEMSSVTGLTALSQQIALVVGLGIATTSLHMFSNGPLDRSDIWPAIVLMGAVTALSLVPIRVLLRQRA